ncbi:LysR family transcriptional regulator [Sphingorhabdus contaminans]|uniref:LysR family transcriptional regulator n=1 Tax=Sphingorhabdus contaminans TaxID=1343899 RepID=UPI003D270353
MLDPRDLDDLIAIWQAGSLSAAAKRRRVAISTISRRIESLEKALKLRLVDRQAKGTTLTYFGELIAKTAEPIAEQLARVNRLADGLRSEGANLPVRLSATEFVISDILAPALPTLWAQDVDFPVHLQSQADVVSLAARNADIAVRMSRPEGASLIMRKLPSVHLGFFAARSYLDNRAPSEIDLRHERLLVYDDSYGRLPELDWLEEMGLRSSVALRTGSTRGLMTAAISGAGIGLLPVAIAQREKELVAVPTAIAPPPRNPWLIVHRDLRHQPSIRIVHKWVLSTFAALVGGGA